ncbi:MAG TPA: hypothetical protein VFU23_15755 [Gemmatimonadales bacterium]|nr:hypothetical protein [Gemmatimonadales bacterium]
MRLTFLVLVLLLGTSAIPSGSLVAQATDSLPPKPRKPPSKLRTAAAHLADTAATAAAGAGVQSLLGKKATGVANALGAGGLNPCAPGATSSAGAAIVGVAKGVVKRSDSTPPLAPSPCAAGVQIPGMPAGAAGALPAANTAAVQAAAQAANPMGGAMGAMAAMTPIGLAVGAAPMAGKAAKGLKGMLGGKPQDKIAMLRELGKGRLELKDVKFIEGTAELEPGFEATFAALGEAVQLAEGTYILHVAAEAGEKGAAPDTALARKRIEKVWAALLVNGVSDQRIIAVGVLPKELQEGRQAPKPGKARVEFIRLPKQP